MKASFFKIFITVICFLGFLLIATSIVDPDFPWHMRHGSEILSRQFNFKDQYSFTMPSFVFVNHSWLTSVIFAKLYLTAGYGAVAVFCAGVATIGAYILCRKNLWLMPLLCASYIVGYQVRSHVLSFLFFSFLLLLLNRYLKKKTAHIYVLPLLFGVWANMHGGFLLGVIFLWGFFFVEILFKHSSKKDERQFFLLTLLSTLCTFLTPYVFGTWEEALRTVTNPLLRQYIAEWQPMSHLTSFAFLMISAFFLMSVWYKRTFSWFVISGLLLAVQSVLSIRIVPFFCIVAVVVISDCYGTFYAEYKKKLDKRRLDIFLRGLTFISIVIFIIEVAVGWRTRILAADTAYPISAVEYITTQKIGGNIFSITHWNNYLLWKAPHAKVFVDGRMLVWKQTGKQKELHSAFEDYLAITLQNKPLAPYLDRFCIQSVLWDSYKTDSIWSERVSPIDVTKQLDKNVWIKEYEDDLSFLYTRELPPHCKQSSL